MCGDGPIARKLVKRWQAIFAAVVLFLTGAVSGGLATKLYLLKTSKPASRPAPASPQAPWAAQRMDFLRRVSSRLDLTPDQKARLDKIIEASQERMRELWEPVAPQAQAEFQQVRTQMEALLTEPQKAKLQAILAERKNHAQAEGTDRRWRDGRWRGQEEGADAARAKRPEASGPCAWEADGRGWIDLLPPEDLRGWTRVPVPSGIPLGRGQWHVDPGQGTLVCDGDGGHDMLLCDREYGNAIFHFEFRYPKMEGKTGYNSGAYVRNSPDGLIWHQAQFGDASGGFLFGESPRFFTLAREVKDGRIKPAGEWNTVEITAVGSKLTLWVNGAVTCTYDGCSRPRGYLGFEGEGYRIEFRQIKVKELP